MELQKKRCALDKHGASDGTSKQPSQSIANENMIKAYQGDNAIAFS